MPELDPLHTASRNAAGVVVLGMGRSGTSAVTGLFVSAGFSAGDPDDLLPADRANPTGYYENRSIVNLNEEILRTLRGSWFDPPSEEAQNAARNWAAPKCAAALLRLFELTDGAPLALKDPRIGVMMPLWAPIFTPVLHPVLVVRDPLEIALSLERRDGTPRAFTLASWELHMTSVLAWLRRSVVTVAPYAALLESDEVAAAVVDATARHLKPACALHVHPGNAGGKLQPGLHRHHATGGEDPRHLTGRQLELWQFLSALTPGDCTLDPPDSSLRAGELARLSVQAESSRLEVLQRVQSLQQELGELRTVLAEKEEGLRRALDGSRWREIVWRRRPPPR